MNIKRMIAVAPVILALALFWGFQASAYFLVTADPPESGRCSQCHSFPGDNHTFHINAGFSCSLCHGDFSGPVETSACSSCHGAEDILNVHAGVEAPNGEYCGYCHEGVGTEAHTWTELKNIFD
jgi:hypothetical protein